MTGLDGGVLGGSLSERKGQMEEILQNPEMEKKMRDWMNDISSKNPLVQRILNEDMGKKNVLGSDALGTIHETEVRDGQQHSSFAFDGFESILSKLKDLKEGADLDPDNYDFDDIYVPGQRPNFEKETPTQREYREAMERVKKAAALEDEAQRERKDIMKRAQGIRPYREYGQRNWVATTVVNPDGEDEIIELGDLVYDYKYSPPVEEFRSNTDGAQDAMVRVTRKFNWRTSGYTIALGLISALMLFSMLWRWSWMVTDEEDTMVSMHI